MIHCLRTMPSSSLPQPQSRPGAKEPLEVPALGLCPVQTTVPRAGWLALLALLSAGLGCSDTTKAAPTKAEVDLQPGLYSVDNPNLFKLATVESRALPSVLNTSASINPDVNRTIHVTSQGSGRVSDLRVKLGDYVRKGQVLLSIYSAELAGAFSDYRKAVADERLSAKALDRAQLLYAHGAMAQKDLEAAQGAEDKAKADVESTANRVRLLGGDLQHPGATIELRTPVSGTIVEQNVAGSEGIKTLDNSPNLFTIADLSQVWVLADVYENDLGQVQLGDPAEIRLNAYPDKLLRGKVADISRVLDPNTRSAKVRIVLPNPDGLLKPGMFARVTFRSRKTSVHLVIPSTAIMRLQDKDWVFRREADNKFRKVEVRSTVNAPDGLLEVEGPLHEGQEIVADALNFSTAMAENGQ